MTHYTQLNEFERKGIYEGLKMGLSQGKIAKKISRDKATISREIARNSDYIGYLYPRDAQKQSEDRKARHGSKIGRKPDLKAYVIEKAKLGWAPTIIAGCWSKDNPGHKICAEAIYQFAYHKNNKELGLWKLFPRAKKKRGVVRKQRLKKGIPHRVSIHERPVEIETRESSGHYEADLMFNKGSQSANVLTIIERKSRMVSLVKHESKHSKPIITSIKQRIGISAKSCTFDNGREFVLHHKLGVPTFFCDPGSPWQKGSVENMNKLLRRYLPFSLESHLITQEYLDSIAYIINNTPRKILGFLTPQEVLDQENSSQSRVKPDLPAAEVAYQNINSVALHY